MYECVPCISRSLSGHVNPPKRVVALLAFLNSTLRGEWISPFLRHAAFKTGTCITSCTCNKLYSVFCIPVVLYTSGTYRAAARARLLRTARRPRLAACTSVRLPTTDLRTGGPREWAQPGGHAVLSGYGGRQEEEEARGRCEEEEEAAAAAAAAARQWRALRPGPRGAGGDQGAA
eukprot:COSAG02_NODE_18202_length_953_cov_3.920375_1_plen_174_part_10